jgi:hypothetical protein
MTEDTHASASADDPQQEAAQPSGNEGSDLDAIRKRGEMQYGCKHYR